MSYYKQPRRVARTKSTMAHAIVQPWMAAKHFPDWSREQLKLWLLDAGVADRTVTTQLYHLFLAKSGAPQIRARPSRDYAIYDDMTKQQWLDFIEATRP